MPQARPLFELQQTDLEIESAQAALRQVEGQLGEESALLKARAQLQAEEEGLGKAEKEQRSLEGEVEDMTARIKTETEKLYGGKVGSSKELSNIQQEVEALQERKREREDSLLEVMGKVEETQSAVKLERAHLQQLEAKWREEQQQLAGEKATLEERLSALEENRQEMARSIAAEDLHLYTMLRQSKGRAVVRIELGRCQGCRLTLSVAELQQAKTGRITQCHSCGRILFTG